MDLRRYVPGFVRTALAPIRRMVGMRPATHLVPPAGPIEKKSRDDLHAYWRKPDDGANDPRQYVSNVNAQRQSEYLVSVVKSFLPPSARILEIGCNAGRNLHHLFAAGFKNLKAIEISRQALDVLRKSFPELASVPIINNSVEAAIRSLADEEFDLVFTMAVLEHIHDDSAWVFKDMTRVTRKYLFTLEDETQHSWRHFPRNYKDRFESLGMKQIREQTGEAVVGIGGGFVGRLFVRS